MHFYIHHFCITMSAVSKSYDYFIYEMIRRCTFCTYFMSAVLVSGGTASRASSKKLLQTEIYLLQQTSNIFGLNVNPICNSMSNQWQLDRTYWAVGVVNNRTVSCTARMSARACWLPSTLKRVTHDIKRDNSSATVSTICVNTRGTRFGDTRCTCK